MSSTLPVWLLEEQKEALRASIAANEGEASRRDLLASDYRRQAAAIECSAASLRLKAGSCRRRLEALLQPAPSLESPSPHHPRGIIDSLDALDHLESLLQPFVTLSELRAAVQKVRAALKEGT